MKKIFKVMTVLLALGMLFASCSPAPDATSGNNGSNNSGSNTGNNDYRELTAADLSDTSFLIGKFVMDIDDIEITYKETCPEQAKNTIKENFSTTLKENLIQGGMGTFENKTAAEADAYANNLKSALDNGGKIYINGSKSKAKLVQEQTIQKNDYITSVKYSIIFTKQ